MKLLLDALSVFILLLMGYCVGYPFGHRAGVKETEVRWSEAVKRKETAVPDLLGYGRLLELCDLFGVTETDELKHRLEDWERWNRAIREEPLDNHHNALTCPYCNPDGLVLAKEHGELMPDSHLMTVAEQQIDWVGSNFALSREAGRLALLSILMDLRDTIRKLKEHR